MNVLSLMKRRQLSDQQPRQWPLCFSLAYVGLGLLLCSLMILLSACSSSSPDGGSSSTDTTASTPIATSTTAPAVSSPTAVPATITLQVVGCPSASVNWDAVVGTHANV